MTAQSIMIQGTGSGVGKSLLTAALCRYFYKEGRRVVPFKAQNMSLNSCITPDGGEMGRAQAYQAEACGLVPHVSMNPILLKPSEDNRSQVIVMGKVAAENDAKQYFGNQGRFKQQVEAAYDTLKDQYELIILEGAGSPAEINLRHCDLVNMPMAHYARSPVLIVGDIDRGGVFAWMKGTWDLLTREDQDRVAGFVINKFRGDQDLLTPGIEEFESMVGRPVLGVVPFYRDLFVDEEDAIPPMPDSFCRESGPDLDVVVLRLPRISNFTDFAPLAHDPAIHLRYAWSPDQVGRPDLLIIPGTKNTLADCRYLQESGLDQKLVQCRQQGTVILGICGGFQMMGRTIRDPQQVESQQGEISGLGLFNMETQFQPEKATRGIQSQVVPGPLLGEAHEVTGYVIHHGVTSCQQDYLPFFQSNGISGNALGIQDDTGDLIGTYLHGLFDADPFRNAFLNGIRKKRDKPLLEQNFNYQLFRNRHLDRLADLARDHLDMKRIKQIIGVAE